MESDIIAITNALYHILDFLPDIDPLKNRAKDRALCVLDSLVLIIGIGGWVSVQEYLRPGREVMVKKLLEDLDILESYLRLAKLQGWVSDVNFLIISKEYQAIREKMKAFKIPSAVQQASLKSPAVNEEADKPRIEAQQEKKVAVTPKAKSRQEKIIDKMRMRDKTQVADLIKDFPNITKRTLRRDLDDLLRRGTILRKGAFNQVFYTVR